MIPNYQYQQPMANYNQMSYIQPQQAWNQPIQQPQQRPSQFLNGRTINNFNDIQPGEIPMDGSRSYFPTTDESVIFVKFWNNEGKLDHKRYVLVDETSQPDTNPDILDTINSRFDKLEKMFNRQNYKHQNPNKKEAES